jgi:hypothetical protein
VIDVQADGTIASLLRWREHRRRMSSIEQFSLVECSDLTGAFMSIKSPRQICWEENGCWLWRRKITKFSGWFLFFKDER